MIKLLLQHPGTFFSKVFRALRWPLCDPLTFFKEASARASRPMKEEYAKRFSMTLKDWMTCHQKEIVLKKCYWMGVRTLKNPLDMWIYQEIIHEVKPEIIIEIGSAEGGSTLYFANMLDLLGKGQIISIEIDRTTYTIEHPRIITLTGDSSSRGIVEKTSRLCSGKRVMVIHDGDHHKDQVLKDLDAYSGLVSVNSYFIVEDSVIDIFNPGDGVGTLWSGPLEAIEEFLSKNTDFVIDEERERYILTYSLKGFLKRVR